MALTGSVGGRRLRLVKLKLNASCLLSLLGISKAGQIVFNFHHAAELLEILARGGAFDSEKFFDGSCRPAHLQMPA